VDSVLTENPRDRTDRGCGSQLRPCRLNLRAQCAEIGVGFHDVPETSDEKFTNRTRRRADRMARVDGALESTTTGSPSSVIRSAPVRHTPLPSTETVITPVSRSILTMWSALSGWGGYAMRRLVSAAVLLVVLTAALAQVAQASGTFAEWRVAGFANAPGRGDATSVLSVCAATDGTLVGGDPSQLKCGAGQAGPANDILSPRVTTILRGRHPGEAWQLDVFDRGTCNAVTHVVVRLPSITIAANGRGTSRLLFSAGQYAAVAAAFKGSLTLRLTHRGLHYCSRYGPTLGGQ
jgi:hypothetical protein